MKKLTMNNKKKNHYKIFIAGMDVTPCDFPVALP